MAKQIHHCQFTGNTF
uniref:Uncharacterized protein n=1 Tax=Anguilla anguilla TaxID=7936 RepID=A0A0E9UV79_ANGAN